jgi:hypothetical protein
VHFVSNIVYLSVTFENWDHVADFSFFCIFQL